MSNPQPVRTRFAPSPTGYLHIGSLRTVLFSWLLARQTGGQFFLRIEDTDRKRLVADAESKLLQALKDLQLDWDEGPDIGGPYGPYRQSERLDIYHRYAEQMTESGHLYKCYCTSERLQAVNAEKQARKEAPGYDRHCRDLSAQEHQGHEAAGGSYVLRLSMPLEGQTVVNDLITGASRFDNALQQDLVMIKSDGYPTYHLAVVVDDHEMKVTHVIRGQEWLSTAPVHVQLYKYFGWDEPVWVHVAAVLGADGKKLSKRFGDTAVTDYLERGFIPEAIINYLCLLGWNPGEDRELMDRDELIARFDLKRLIPSGGMFDVKKLTSFNAQHLRQLSDGELVKRLLPLLVADGLIGAEPDADVVAKPDVVAVANADDKTMAKLLRLAVPLKERMTVLPDALPLIKPFFVTPEPAIEDLVQKRTDAATTASGLLAAREALSHITDWTVDNIDATLKECAQAHPMSKLLYMALRIAITGSAISLPMTDTLAVLGRKESLTRIDRAVAIISAAE